MATCIAAIGDIGEASAPLEIWTFKGLAVAPGFVNMMCWSNESLIEDGNSQSDIRQGVTLEIMGEGDSMGPLNDRMKEEMVDSQGDIHYASNGQRWRSTCVSGTTRHLAQRRLVYRRRHAAHLCHRP